MIGIGRILTTKLIECEEECAFLMHGTNHVYFISSLKNYIYRCCKKKKSVL